LETKARKEKQQLCDQRAVESREEEEKLKQLQQEIADLKAKLKTKKEEEKLLQEQKALKEKDREQSDLDQEQHLKQIMDNTQSTNIQLENHQKTQEWLARFVGKISQVQEMEVLECIRKTKDILVEQEKEMIFFWKKKWLATSAVFPYLAKMSRSCLVACGNFLTDAKQFSQIQRKQLPGCRLCSHY